jgi:hypothetical protein
MNTFGVFCGVGELVNLIILLSIFMTKKHQMKNISPFVMYILLKTALRGDGVNGNIRKYLFVLSGYQRV